MGCYLRFAAAASCATWLAATSAALAAPPPVSAYAALPPGAVRLSPDGSAVAMVGSVGGKPAFIIQHLYGTPPTIVPTGSWLPDWIEWKTPTLLLAGVHTTYITSNDRPLQNGRLLILASDGSKITPVDLSFARYRGLATPLMANRVVSLLPHDPLHVLMATLDPAGPDVSEIDVRDGSRSQVQDSRTDVFAWHADPDGVVRVGEARHRPSSTRRSYDYQILARASAADGWHTILTQPINGKAGASFAGFDASNPNLVRLAVPDPGGNRVVRAWRIDTGQPGEVVAQLPGADVAPLGRNQTMTGYVAEGTQDREIYFDARWQQDAQAIGRALGREPAIILDRTPDGKHVLAAMVDWSTPTEYWILDRSGSKTTLKLVSRTYEDVPADAVAPVRWITFTARDGMQIPALLTVPSGKPAGGLPFVVMPHGGPSVHDGRVFDWEAQFLASRGYGVLQPQFRGSTGFGTALFEAGRRQWGQAMQDDITDGTKYLIARHLANPARIAIVGASFGGYAALEGVVREPALYRCAAALAPVTDLPTMVGGPTAFAQSDLNLPLPGADYGDIARVSPAEHADDIKVPILLVHGRMDFTVPVLQSEMMASALKSAGRKVQTIYLEDADHQIERIDERLVWLQALESFLATNLGATK